MKSQNRVQRSRRMRRRARARRRRGILLLVVLSMLVLFVLVGAAFLVTSSNYRTGSRVMEKSHRNAPQPGDLLSRALRQVLRDTRNPASAVRYHSLLRDVYGTDGFVAQVFQAEAPPLRAQYAGAVFTGPAPLGPTDGQLVDIFVRDIDYDYLDPQPALPDSRHVVALELNDRNLPVDYDLPRTDGYFNGCLLTLLDGPARGQTARIIDYEYLNDNVGEIAYHESLGEAITNLGPVAGETPEPVGAPMFRFRVVAFPRADGAQLTLGDGVNAANDLMGRSFMVNGRPFNGAGVGLNVMAGPTGAQLTAYEAAFRNGTSPISNAGDFFGAPVALFPNAKFYRRVYQDPTSGQPSYNIFRGTEQNGVATVAQTGAWLSTNGADVGAAEPNPNLPRGVAPPPNIPPEPHYTSFDGPGGADESYDAPDYHNMYLASMPLNPRARARVVRPDGEVVEVAEYYANRVTGAPLRLDLEGLPIPSYHRPALVNFWIHRLYNAPWLQQAVGSPEARVKAILQPFGPDGAFNSGDEYCTPVVAAQIVAFKRKYTLRPLEEDHPEFEGSNPQRALPTIFAGLGEDDLISSATGVPQITFPSPEVAGPWDVDNDNDGVPDSVWVDLGMPVQETEDGRLYKPLFAIMIQDLDGRLNLNAHGSQEHLVAAKHDFSNGGSLPDPLRRPVNGGANLADGITSTQGLRSSDQLPPGSGYGPADVSLRPALSPGWPIFDVTNNAPPFRTGNPNFDDYARLLGGRVAPDVTATAAAVGSPTIWGRYGVKQIEDNPRNPLDLNVAPAIPFRVSTDLLDLTTLDPLPFMEMFGYPNFSRTDGRLLADPAIMRPDEHQKAIALGAGQPSGFGTLPDLRASFAIGLDYGGQPTYEAEYRARVVGIQGVTPLLPDSPYELDLMSAARRDHAGLDVDELSNAYTNFNAVNDDAPFSSAELERILRAFDADAGRLPDRLWSVVDAFDPDKLAVQLHQVSTGATDTSGYTPSPGQLLQAQIEAASRRRIVTTESYDIPSTNEHWTSRLRYGADGQPGVAGVNDDGDTNPTTGDPLIDELDELNAPGSDDYYNVMGEQPPESARLLDYLRYRVILELKQQDPTTYPATMVASTPALEQAVNMIIHGDNSLQFGQVRSVRASFGGLLAPEVIAGRKMDLNRPFGDGKDNGDGIDNNRNGVVDDASEIGIDPFLNGVVDEPAEAGEAYIDQNNNGVWDDGEPFLESNGIPGFQFPVQQFPLAGDRLWNGQGDPTSLANTVPFDHTAGQDANGRGAFAVSAPIRDDAQMARQLYARHLYSMAMLLMDENYLMPVDRNDPQVVDYLDPGAKPNRQFGRTEGSVAWQIAQTLAGDDDLNGTPAATDAQKVEAIERARRKLTCRMIAQWAINCADMRDPDAICTPFEYDENPWDGWNVVDTVNGQVYPLDGDIGTNENLGDYRQVTDRGWQNVDNAPVVPPLQTRGVVWGTERPELLITETFAGHDRRVEDLAFENLGVDPNETDAQGNPLPTTNLMLGEQPPPEDENVREDFTMDQRLMPDGFLFVEVYNPWSPDGQKPAEFYRGRNLDGDPQIDTPLGVDLSLLSAVGVDGTTLQGDPITRYSPVWRMIAVEDHPRLRNDDDIDDADEAPYSNLLPKAYEQFNEQTNPAMLRLARSRQRRPAPPGAAQPAPARATIIDTDFPTFNQDAQPRVMNNTRVIERTTPTGEPPVPAIIERVQFRMPRQYVERSFYFTSDDDGKRNPADLHVRIPLQRIKIPEQLLPQTWRSYLDERSNSTIPGRPGGANVSPAEGLLWPNGMSIVTERDDQGRPTSYLELFTHHFVPSQNEVYKAEDLEDPAEIDFDLAIAPILPGRYGVIGTAGFSYVEGRRTGLKRHPGRFITPIGRRTSAIGPDQEDTQPITGDEVDPDTNQTTADGKGTRRIELLPYPDPETHQVLIADNAGNESRIVDYDDPADDLYDRNVTNVFQVSVRDDVLAGFGGARRPALLPSDPERFIQPAVAIPVKGMSLSTPLDNYLLRWMELEPGQGAPEPGRDWEPKGAGGEGEFVDRQDRDQYAPFDEPFDLPRELVENHTTPNYRSLHLQRLANPLLPWNPMPGEEFHETGLPVNPYLTVDAASADLTAYSGVDPKEQQLGDQGDDRRGKDVLYPAQLHESSAPLPGGGGDRQTVMTLASQQRGFHTITVNEQPRSARAVFASEAPNQLHEVERIRLNFDNMVYTPSGRPTGFTDDLAPALVPRQHVIDFPFRHSLGYMNEDFGRFYTQTDADDSGAIEQYERFNDIDTNGDGILGDLVGSPKAFALPGGPVVDDTFPWLYWGNRPYASPLEVLQVPVASSARMSGAFSMFNPAKTPQTNPYNGQDVNPFSGPDRCNYLRETFQASYYGHLLNVFNASIAPAVTSVVLNSESKPELRSAGSPNLHRLVDYVHVPSPFVGTQATLNPTVWNPLGELPTDRVDNVNSPLDPRNEMLAPFNKVDQYREPGRVNLNTVVGRTTTNPWNSQVLVLASPVYDGLMHRVADQNYYASNALIQLGHRGPAWAHVMASRRGYNQPAPPNGPPPLSPDAHLLHPLMPTFFANPFRASGEGALVPLDTMIRPGSEATLLRSHVYSPDNYVLDGSRNYTYETIDAVQIVQCAQDALWGSPDDDNRDLVLNDTTEAGTLIDPTLPPDVLLFENSGLPMPYSTALVDDTDVAEDPENALADDIPVQRTRVPLFSGTETEPSLNGLRNPALRYMPMTRLSSMTTTRSGALAIWITVGYFEVKPAPDWNNPAVQQQFLRDRQLYDMVYPDGYQLGRELGSETGDTTRRRAFWIVDRTLPVAFKPGEDVNIENMILLQRRIE